MAYFQEKDASRASTPSSEPAVDDDVDSYGDDDSHIYFSPDQGNVVFASAVDGWAFRIDEFADIYASRLGLKRHTLKKVLWGDYYLEPKTKKMINQKQLKGRFLKPIFVQFVLDNIWAVYRSVFDIAERPRLEKIVATLGLKMQTAPISSPRTTSHLFSALCTSGCHYRPQFCSLSLNRPRHPTSPKAFGSRACSTPTSTRRGVSACRAVANKVSCRESTRKGHL